MVNYPGATFTMVGIMEKKKYNIYGPNIAEKIRNKYKWYSVNDIPLSRWPIFVIRKRDFDAEQPETSLFISQCKENKKFKAYGFEVEIDDG